MISHSIKLPKQAVLIVSQFIVMMSHSQTLSISVKASLPSILTESSGIEISNRNSIWSHNDGGGNCELYNFDSTGTMLRTLKILNSTNIDWEDLAKDAAGNFYIGDFGNNNNTRQDLKIYVIPNPENIIGDSIIPQVINYSYSDQYAFPPPNSIKNFDMEAMLAYGDSLYLFSKDWSSPYSGYTKLYKLPLIAGTYVAELIDSFYTGPGSPIVSSVTSADISSDNSKIILLGYNKCWLFSNFIGNDFFSGTHQLFNLPTMTQKEAICFISDHEFYVTDESASGTGQQLYYLNIQQMQSAIIEEDNNEIQINIFPNPFSGKCTISISTGDTDDFTIAMYNQLGQNIFNKIIFSSPESVQDIVLDETILKNNSGIFMIEVSRKNKQILRKKIVKLF